jgi:hypothetical protein
VQQQQAMWLGSASGQNGDGQGTLSVSMRSIIVIFFTIQIILVIYPHLAVRPQAQMMSHVI